MIAETKPTRAERAVMAQALRSEGLKYREIAERMRLSISYVQSLVKDPEDIETRKRKASYVKPCPRCGNPAASSGNDGKDTPPRLCEPCYLAEKHDTRFWTRERIIEWIRAYVAEHGSVPPAGVLVTTAVGMGTATVRREFPNEGWRAAVRAAGFTPLKDYEGRGGPLGRDHPLMQERLRLYEAGVPKDEIARRQGVTKHAVDFSIDRYVEGKVPMSSRLSPTAVLEREKERAELRIESLKADIDEEQRNVVGLTAALEALAAAHSNGNGNGRG